MMLTRNEVIEQLIESLGAFPLPDNFNLAAMAEKLANELEQASGNINEGNEYTRRIGK